MAFHAQHPGGGPIRPVQPWPAMGPCLDALDYSPHSRAPAWLCSPHLLGNTGLVMPIEAVGPRLVSHHPRHPVAVDAGAECVPAGRRQPRRPISTPLHRPQVLFAVQGPGWCGPSSDISAIKTTAGDGAAWPMRTMPGLDGPGVAHDPGHHDVRRFEYATSCAPFDGRVCAARSEC